MNPEFVHPPQHVLLTQPRALRIDHRIEGRGSLGQTSQHRRFGQRQFAERLAEIDLRGRGETVGTLSEEDLVDVQLEDLVLAQIVLDLERQQRFVELAGIGLFRRKEEVLRHLLGNRRCPLPLAAAHQVGVQGAQDALRIDAAVLIEALVLGGQDRLLHDRRNVLDADHRAPLLAELAEQVAIGRIDAQRHLRPIVGQDLQRRQVRVGHAQDYGGHGHRHRRQTEDHDQRVKQPAEYSRQQSVPAERANARHYIGRRPGKARASRGRGAWGAPATLDAARIPSACNCCA
jgi:hypothetical protein